MKVAELKGFDLLYQNTFLSAFLTVAMMLLVFLQNCEIEYKTI